MPKYFRSLLIVGIVLLAAQVLAVPPQPPQFVDSTTYYLKGTYCEVYNFTFEAKVVDPPPGSDNPIRYHLISGPGQLDSRTGEWVWQPSLEEFKGFTKVIVAASIGGNEATMTTGDDNFELSIYVINGKVDVFLRDYRGNPYISVLGSGPHVFDIEFVDRDTCEIPEVSELSFRNIYPRPLGSITIEERQIILDLAPEDIGRKFFVELIGNIDGGPFLVSFMFDTRSEINVAFTSCPPELNTTMCEAVIYQLKASDFAPDSVYIIDGVRYQQISGPGYLSPAGKYTYVPTIAEGGITYDVAIQASYITDLITAVDTCRFDLVVEGYQTEIKLKDQLCGDTVVFDARPLSWGIGLEGRHFGDCDLKSINVTTDSPIAGTVYFDSSIALGSYYWFYYPAPEDGNKTIKLTFAMETTGSDSIYCELYLQNNWSTPEEQNFKVRVDYLEDIELGATVDVPVYLDEASIDIGGYDFLMEFDRRSLIFKEANLGELFGENGCGWEYFTYRNDSALYNLYYFVLKIVAIAEINNGESHPSCLLPENLPVELFRLTFDVTTQFDRECRQAAVRFRWADCGDNSMSSADGENLYVSDKVFYHDIENPETLVDYTNPSTGFPTITGFQPLECASGFEAMPSITFINGGIQIICSDTLGTFITGDVNLNGIAFELADLYHFKNYFVYDTAIFGDNVARSSKTTDINGDGVLLSVADWQYMSQMLIGSMLDPGENLKDTLDASFILLDNNSILVATADYEFGAIQVVLSGDNHPTLLRQEMQMSYAYDTISNVTRVFVYSISGQYFDRGNLLGNITGALLDIEVTDIEGRIIRAEFNTGESVNYQIKIARIDQALQGQNVTVPVYLDSAAGELGGFDLLFEYDNRILSFQMAEAGSLFDTAFGCGWEYFTYRFDPSLNDSLFTVVRVVALAETNNGPIHPTCYLPGTMPGELFHFKFLVSNDRKYECDFAQIRFLWNECSDNMLVNTDGQELYVSKKVYTPTENNLYLTDITDPNTGYPTITGYQSAVCSTSVQNIHQDVNFVNGGVAIICANEIDLNGDVNFNGIPYEIADMVLFEKSFVYGVDQFIVNLEKQIKATDVNRNGSPLEVADWQYLLRIILGDALSGYDFMFDTLSAEISYDNDRKVLKAFTDMDYAAMYVVIAGEYIPVFYHIQMDIDFAYDETNDRTHIFIYSIDGNYFGAGDILGNIQSEIIKIEVTDTFGHVVLTTLDFVLGVENSTNLLPDQFGLAQNYPNPFNNATVINFSLPTSSRVQFEVFNVLGERVHAISKNYDAGYQTIYWEGDNVASGIYYYRLTAGDFVATKKMILLK